MEELTALFFGILGLSSYPLIFFLSLKKSVSLTSKRNVAGSKTLLSLVAVYLETALLSFLIAYFFPFDWPPYTASLVALSAIALTTGYTLKAAFGLTYWRGILAFFLWQALSLALGGLLVVTVMAAMLETIFTLILIITFGLVAWWMWGSKGLGLSLGHNHLHLGWPDRRAMTVAMVILLCSSLVVPSALCAPEEMDVDFTWENNGVRHTVGANITWNATSVNATTQGTLGQGQANGATEFGIGVGQGVVDIAWGIINFTSSLYSLHDYKATTTYLSLINDVTQLQHIMGPQEPLPPVNCPFDIRVGRESASEFAKDGALAGRLSGMDRKGFKVEVAENPDYISKSVDIERYVDGVAWDSALTNYFTLNIPLTYETYMKVKAETGSELEALYQAAKVFGGTSVYCEAYEAALSGDWNRIGRSGTKAVISFASTFFMLRSAQRMARGEGVIEAVTKTAFDYVMPGQFLYGILKSGLSRIKGALSDIGDADLRGYLEGAWANLKARLTGYEYLPFLYSDEEVFSGVMPNDVLSNVPGIIVVPPEKNFDWSLLKMDIDSSITKKISSDSWVRYFINAIKDYKKLDQIGEGETEVLGLKIDMEKGILNEGNPNSMGKSYFDLKIVDTGSTIRVYEDNTVSVWHNGGFRRLKTEQLEAFGANIEPLETNNGLKSGTDLTTILMRNYLEKIGFYDKFVVGQETVVFGIKGTVKANGVSTDGPYVTIAFEADTGIGSGIKEVRITPKGATVNKYTIVGVVTGEDGAVYLCYKHDEIIPTLIKLPDIIVNQGKLVDAYYLTTGFDYNDIEGKTGTVDLFGELDIQSSKEFTRRVAYAAQGGNEEAFDTKYGEGKCKALWKAADVFSELTSKEAVENMGMKVKKMETKAGVRPGPSGEDILITTQDGIELKLDIEYAGEKGFSQQIGHMAQKFTEGKADIGIIFWEGEYHIFINSATKYEPLANIAKDIESAGSRNIKDFAGITAIGGLGLLSGYFSDAKGEAMSVTDDSGGWIGEFHDSYLDHTNVDGSAVYESWLALTSVERSYLQNVRSSGTTIAGSTLTNCNVSAKLIYDSIVQNTLAVCSYIANSVIDLCRILNSTLVSVMGLKGSHIEDTTIANSADISNCTVIGSNLMSVVNLANTSVTGSNLTMVANVDNTKIDRSDISYSANISRSDIVNTMLRGCTVQGSKLTSCTAVDSILRNVNATNTNLSGTSAEFSNLVNVNATNSKLTKANVEYSNLNNVELKRAEVIGTDLANRKIVDQTIVYGRVIDSNDNIIDPWRRVGTPNYASQSPNNTTDVSSSGKGGSIISSTTASSSSSQTKTSNANSQASTMRQKQVAAGFNTQQTSNAQTQTSNTKASNTQAATNQQVPPMMRQKLGGQVKADTGSSAQTSSSTQTTSPQKTTNTTTTTSPQISTTTTSQQTAEKPIMRGVKTWIS